MWMSVTFPMVNELNQPIHKSSILVSLFLDFFKGKFRNNAYVVGGCFSPEKKR